ncbi:MFS transporter [Homoserinibacter sp. GY 40078]|uniref:MFS transporter n=1 Tax=Homoserinibacter sp. GY 40078 TaxID=2603275 RepID=UPI0011C9DE76|nr:MFS transporter [Homoserinibacter sp. GY 40078]TXK17225.1 MFS transporter [Homoserinibacter sp. GY 40078]
MASRTRDATAITFSLVGFLFLVELTSGIIQGFYVPLIPKIVLRLDIHDGDFNWFEAAQLLLSAIVVPIFAKLGDMYGHKRMLLITTALTAGATWWLATATTFTTFLIAWSLQAFYVVWLPLEIALIFDRGRRTGTAASQTRRSAGFLVVALELGAILGALGASRVFGALGEDVMLTLFAPAIVVTLVFFAVLFGVPESEPIRGRRLDGIGFLLLTVGLLAITAGLGWLRIDSSPTGIAVTAGAIVVGLVVLVGFGRWELQHPDPAIDLRVMRRPSMWPVIVTAGLFGISVLGAQAPLATYAGTDPELVGYGLGLDTDALSNLIGVYLVSMIVGALLFAAGSRRISPRLSLILATGLVALGYLLFLPFHLKVAQVMTNMAIAGLGSGALVAALPAAAAAAAPRGQTGVASGMTNTTKTIVGSFASAIFGVALVAGAESAASSIAPLAGYLTVWAISGGGAVVAMVFLFFVPKLAFADVEPELLPDLTPAE